MTPVIHIKKTNHNTNDVGILFVHGAGGGAWYFKHYLDYFSAHGYDTYAIDLRGHGENQTVDDYHLDDYVDDVIFSLKNIHHQKMFIIGHSMGGAVVLKTIEKANNLCNLAVLMSPPPLWGIDIEDPLGLFFDDMMGFLRQRRKALPTQKINMLELLSKMMFNDHLCEDEIQDIRKKLVKESHLIRQDLLKPYINDIAKIQTPMLLIGSSADRLVHESDLKEMAFKLKSKLIMLDDLPHFMMLDPNWEQSAEAILKEISKF